MSEQEQNLRQDLQIDSSLSKKFELLGFNELTKIQKKAIPHIFSKEDCIITAPTGSGKTECSVIPIFSHVSKTKQKDKIKLLYVTPLRSLNRDVFRRITDYAHQDDLEIEVRHGDTSQAIRKKISNSPPDDDTRSQSGNDPSSTRQDKEALPTFKTVNDVSPKTEPNSSDDDDTDNSG